MKKIIGLMFFFTIPLVGATFAEKYLFETEKECLGCVGEIKKKEPGNKKEYRCKSRTLKPGVKQYFVMMTFADSRESELTRFLESENKGKKEGYSVKKKFVLKQQVGLTKEQIRQACPGAYKKSRKKP
ncbi:MAG: hypothetical protein GY754_28065 [bacterium]|nr:hypothetical protein [bacterium]